MGGAQIQSTEIHTAGPGDLMVLRELADLVGTAKDPDYFERCIESQQGGGREILIIRDADAPAGYCMLNWNPRYALFRKLGVPEIQDLSIIPAYRRRGLARALIAHCEELARARGCDSLGLGVGISAAFGPAQRLYVQAGYVPDGNGVCFDRQQVAGGEIRPLDENLCLMMIKSLK